ncbi:MAG: hypothetical protein COU10_02985 [Candidatus Harrisonbacteria bacterium CG10_big_fil_rev_8_21_14_0_10_45_28]|uniref:Glycoside hydrolase family 57 N-terminal domain-containing protein n=1 Tax=Candidatus Harrisonbacteria bacterium CG10_big_fil_rev_8_21_14_0_10_45_28 TaxID=1974586 RepID=A0A2H0UMW8_9BACT|nr:MAG: hypothetical protein COU10_02985 [Candidatus Harrisonbacteria bacterium CG10_big_fil_rev_8_21_14_0_10_45_28]
MVWANFLHFYQPADQQPDILAAIVAQSYRPLLKGFLENRRARITVNINGSLLELFDKHGYHDLIEALGTLGKRDQLEFTGSAKYHAFLPFLNKEEVARQVSANEESLKYYLKDGYKKNGFFPPEMAFKEDLAPIIEGLGFKWIIIDEIAYNGKVEQIDYSKTYKIDGANLYVFFRERRPSNLIMSAICRTKESFLEVFKEDLKKNQYMLTGMDGETFGHHRPGLEKTLLDILKAKVIDLVHVSELIHLYPDTKTVLPVQSTWASSPKDIESGAQFLSWSDPTNPIHGWQWKLTDLALSHVRRLDRGSAKYESLRQDMDKALGSDHFWWASAKPWWSVEMIELGANRLLKLIRELDNATEEDKSEAADLYEKIVSTSFAWQRTGKIRELAKERFQHNKIPFKDRTWGLGGVGGSHYRAFIKMMHDLERESAKTGEYERATLWRDSIWRLEKKWDIYEAINTIDLLRTEIGNERVEKMLKKYHDEYHQLRGGQPEDRF